MSEITIRDEPVLAWRVWTYCDRGINYDRKLRLYSVGRTGGLAGPIEHEWPIGKPLKAFLGFGYLGIHAWKDAMRAAAATLHLPGMHFWGGVWLWGELAEHKWGYRAEFAYPACLCGTLSFLFGRIEDVARQYDVPFYFGVTPLDQRRLERRIYEDWNRKIQAICQLGQA